MILHSCSVHLARNSAGVTSRVLFSVCLVAGALGLTGCASDVSRGWKLPGRTASFAPANYVAPGPIPAAIKRVAVLPLHGGTWRAADIGAIESSCVAELGKFERFEVAPLTRADFAARFGAESFLSSAALPADFLARVQADFDVQAVLFLDLTHLAPYQPVALGLRAKLVATADAGVLWSFDSVFDSAQPGVAEAARRYHLEQSRPAYPLENTSGILQSPARFAKYAANAMFRTLPPRESR